MKRILFLALLALTATPLLAKLPALTDEAKAKAAENAAKTAHSDKVGAYKLCQTMDKVAAGYLTDAKKAGKDVKPVATPPCADPGAFVYTPPGAVAAPPPAKKS